MICGKQLPWMETINSCYQTEQIKHICPECNPVVANELSRLQDESFKRIERELKCFILRRKDGSPVRVTPS